MTKSKRKLCQISACALATRHTTTVCCCHQARFGVNPPGPNNVWGVAAASGWWAPSARRGASDTWATKCSCSNEGGSHSTPSPPTRKPGARPEIGWRERGRRHRLHKWGGELRGAPVEPRDGRGRGRRHGERQRVALRDVARRPVAHLGAREVGTLEEGPRRAWWSKVGHPPLRRTLRRAPQAASSLLAAQITPRRQWGRAVPWRPPGGLLGRQGGRASATSCRAAEPLLHRRLIRLEAECGEAARALAARRERRGRPLALGGRGERHGDGGAAGHLARARVRVRVCGGRG